MEVLQSQGHCSCRKSAMLHCKTGRVWFLGYVARMRQLLLARFLRGVVTTFRGLMSPGMLPRACTRCINGVLNYKDYGVGAVVGVKHPTDFDNSLWGLVVV